MAFPAENRLGGRRFPLSVPVELHDDSGNLLGQVLDLSLSGLRLSTPRLLPLNRPHSILLVTGDEPVSVRGTLVWARKGDQPRTFQMGMRFEGLSSEAAKGIERLIRSDRADSLETERAG